MKKILNKKISAMAGERIRYLMRVQNLTLPKVAEELKKQSEEVCQTQVRCYLEGYTPISESKILAFAKIFGVEKDFFTDERELTIHTRFTTSGEIVLSYKFYGEESMPIRFVNSSNNT